MLRRLRIDLAYDGRPFSGFARQRVRATVQGLLEEALERLLGQPVSTVGAGRTDRGVHATAQVVHLDVDPDIGRAQPILADVDELRRRLDQLVGEAVTIWSVTAVSADFHARFSATQRRYRYGIADGPAIDPLVRFDRWHVAESLRVRPMQQASRHLLGEHDFASFCRRSGASSTVRRVDALAVSRAAPDQVHVRLKSPAFCHQMVRSIVGCLVEVGRGRREPEWLAEVLSARDRSAAASVAPPHGLVLEGVSYGRRWPAAPVHVG